MLATCGLAASTRWLLAAALLASLPTLLVREAPMDAFLSLERRGPAPRRVPFRRFLRRTVVALQRPRALRLLALYFGLDAALGLFERPFSIDLFQHQGWEAAGLSRLRAMLTLASGTAGAVAVGVWPDVPGLTHTCAPCFSGAPSPSCWPGP